MNTPANSPGSATASGRHQRSARNYLLDPRFQLKYTALLLAVPLVVSAILGAQLWMTSGAVITQSQHAVEQGRETVRRGQRTLAESKKVSDVVAMSITKDPEYAANPELAALFKEDSAKRDKELADEQTRLENDAALLARQSSYLQEQQNKTFFILFGGLSLLILAIGATGIVFTHKIAGPIFKMKGLLRQVGEGKLKFQTGLRKGDELQHFFDSFMRMVDHLRQRHEADCLLIDQALKSLEGAEQTKLAPLRALREQMRERLDK